MDPTDDFNSDAFFNDGTLQQIEQNAGLDANLQDLSSVPLPSNPAVVQRILNLQYCGSLQDVAWSRQGHIASVSEDGCEVHLECLVFSDKTSSWKLSPKQVIRTALDSITTLVWSPTGGDLAVADLKGRLSILQAHATAMNRFSEVRQGLLDESDEFGQVIGMTWLGQDRLDKPKAAVLHASKNDGRWSTAHGKATPLGPLWQRAVVTVDRKAAFSIFFQKIDGRYGKASIALSQSTGKYYSHAAFSPTTDGKLLVALHSYESTLSVYYVQMDFSEVRQNVEAAVGLSVEVVATRLSSSANGTLMHGDIYDPDSLSLTHLGVVPTSEVENSLQSSPTIYAVYCNNSRGANATDPGYLRSSVYRRWTVIPVEQKLHPRLDDLPPKSADSSTTFTHSVTRLPDKDEQVITSASLIDNGQTLVVTTQDGRIDFLTTYDLSSLMYGASTTEVTSLVSSGFGFPLSASPLCMSLSPNSCMQIVRDPQDKTELMTMEFQHTHDHQPLDLTNPTIDTAIAAILLTFSRACYSNGNIDDLLSCVKHTMPSNAATPMIISLYRTLFRDVEFIQEKAMGSELEKVIQKPLLTKVLSFHWGVSLMGSPASTPFKASLTGQWAWLANNFRFIATLLYLSYRQYLNPLSVAPQELIEILCGNVRWSLNILRFIIASVLEVSDRQTNPDMFDSPAPGESVDGSQGLAALLLNCHWSRFFIIAIVKAIRLFANIQEPRSKQQAQIIRTIHKYSTVKGMNLMALEAVFLNHRWYSDSDTGVDYSEVAMRQIRMMATGVVADAYCPTVKKVLTRLVNGAGGMREKIDRLKLFTDRVDVNELLLHTEWEMTGKGEKKVYDVHKKRLILKGGQETKGAGEPVIKKCVRCGSYNEDVTGSGREWPRHINSLIARCVCDGMWIVEPWEKRDED